MLIINSSYPMKNINNLKKIPRFSLNDRRKFSSGEEKGIEF